MRLNNSSHVHVKIRKLCLQLEYLTNMQLVTELSNDFTQIRFINKLGYILIDYEHETCFTLSHRLTELELQVIQDIMLYCNWLEIGSKVMAKNGLA